jgi:hypothetical protein
MGTAVTVSWIAFDVLICLRTDYMTAPFSWHEWGFWAAFGCSVAIFALIAGYLDGQKHEKEIDDLNGRLDQQRDQLNEQKGMGLGIAAIIGRRLEGIESKITDPQSKAELSELREEVVRKPVLVYDGFDDRSYKWGNGEAYQYVHLRFRNGPTGVRAPEAAAKLSWSNSEQRPLFSVEGKWETTEPGKPVDLLPNNAARALDLPIYHKPEEDWRYALFDARQQIDERYRIHSEVYTVKVTISCEGYFNDFWFRVAAGPTITVREYVSPDGSGTELKDEVRR